MADSFPGPKTRAALERGIPLFKNGLRFDAELERAGQRGFRPVRQIVIDKAEGDFVWDLDGNRYIDFQNGWATNPLGNCHAEILEAVEAANRRYGFHYDHPLRYELAEMLADIMPGGALPRSNYEVSGTGRMWGIEHYDVVPDILVYGKNVSGGIAPQCGISARDEIMGDNKDFASGSTFAGTPAGCAAAIRTRCKTLFGTSKNTVTPKVMQKPTQAVLRASK